MPRKPAKKAPAKKRTATTKVATTRTATAKRKTTARSAAATLALAKTAIQKNKMYTKSQIFSEIAEKVDISKKQVGQVFDVLSNLMERHLKGAGEFKIPGLVKCVIKKKKATKQRTGINPFTGEEMVFKAKPASKTVKVRPLKNLKDMVA